MSPRRPPPSAAAAVYVVGLINTDLVAYVERLPVGGETLFGERFAQFAGGKGTNQAVAAARAGAATTFIGAVGDDAFGSAVSGALYQETSEGTRACLEDRVRAKSFRRGRQWRQCAGLHSPGWHDLMAVPESSVASVVE